MAWGDETLGILGYGIDGNRGQGNSRLSLILLRTKLVLLFAKQRVSLDGNPKVGIQTPTHYYRVRSIIPKP